MGFKDSIKVYLSAAYQHTLKNIKVGDIGVFYKAISDITKTCKTAKGNNTCLGDCIHCDILNNKINEIIKKQED